MTEWGCRTVVARLGKSRRPRGIPCRGAAGGSESSQDAASRGPEAYLRLLLLPLALSACAVIREREQPPRVSTRSEPLPSVRLVRDDRVRVEPEPSTAGLTITSVNTCAQSTRLHTTTTVETERVATQRARELIPLAGGLALGAAFAAGESRDQQRDGLTRCDTRCYLFAYGLLGAVGSAAAVLIDSAREADSVEARTSVVLKTYEYDCAPAPVAMTPVLLVFGDGTRAAATTDGAGRVAVVGGVWPVEVVVRERSWPVERRARDAP